MTDETEGRIEKQAREASEGRRWRQVPENIVRRLS
jgi:hypothetical protein